MSHVFFRIKEVVFLMTVLVFVGCGPSDPVVLDTRVLVEELAGDDFEGRLTGSAGIKKAADYIKTQLNAIGAEPLPGSADFGQPFTYTCLLYTSPSPRDLSTSRMTSSA